MHKKWYNGGMDDRKKRIGELEKQQRGNQAALEVLLEGLGETLLRRSGDEAKGSVRENVEEYRRLQKEIADSEAAITATEAQMAYLKNLDEEIEGRERQDSARLRELAIIHAKLGKLLLEDNAMEAFAAPYREQADVLIPKVRSLEERVAEIADQKEGGNVFTWIGKSAQGMVLRSFLTKSADNLEKLYRNAGEHYCRMRAENLVDGVSAVAEVTELAQEIKKNSDLAQDLAAALGTLREERRQINDEFNAAGGPLRQIQHLRKQISLAKDSLGTLYRRFGEDAFEGSQKDPGKKTEGAAQLLNADDQPVLEQALKLKQSILEDAQTVKKLEAALAIDEEWEEIEKFRKSIAEKQARISEAEKSIVELESRIKDAEKHIEELRQLL